MARNRYEGAHQVKKSEKTFTHYAYLVSPVGVSREPTGMMDLSAASEDTRRGVIHGLIQNGELLATLPFPEIKNMRQLRGALKWLEENRVVTCPRCKSAR